jgi:hypothetical protein
VALNDRLNRLEGEYGPELCEERYCMWAPTFVEVIHYQDGTEELVGEGPPPLCTPCPYHEGGRPVRHVEVVKRY